MLPGNVRAKDCNVDIYPSRRKVKITIKRKIFSNISFVALGVENLKGDKTRLQSYHNSHESFIRSLKDHQEDDIESVVWLNTPFTPEPYVAEEVPNLPGQGIMPVLYRRGKTANVFYFTLKKVTTGYSSAKKVSRSVKVGGAPSNDNTRRTPAHEAYRARAQADHDARAQAQADHDARAQAQALAQAREAQFRADQMRAAQVREAQAQAKQAQVQAQSADQSASSSSTIMFGNYQTNLPNLLDVVQAVGNSGLVQSDSSPSKKRKADDHQAVSENSVSYNAQMEIEFDQNEHDASL